MEKRIRLVAVIGKSGSGKDTIVNAICKMNSKLHKKISITTRPLREGEKQNVDYFYVNRKVFAEKIMNQEIIEATEFNDWFYGTDIKTLDKDKINIGIFNPEGIEQLLGDSRIDLTIVYISCSDKVRMLRSLLRETNPDIDEIIRRRHADNLNFTMLDFKHVEFDNSGTVQLSEIVQKVDSFIKSLDNNG